MTSIIILSYNTKELTKLCIQSIRQHTRPGVYELIVIENASRDGSFNWLKAQPDVKLICNTKNEGFPKGCNQGLAMAKGEDLLLLNSDTVVTPRWLEQMLIALHSSSKVGAVSCCTNSCIGRQRIDTDYGNDMEMMAKFAEQFNHGDSTKWEMTMSLLGFCFLLKREVYEQIGGLDEVFSPGNYEDTDYSLRIRMAGWNLLICRDTFIHHFGNASFTKSSTSQEYEKKVQRYKALIAKNKKILHEKWNLSPLYGRYSPWLYALQLKKTNPDVLLLTEYAGENPYILKHRYRQANIDILINHKGDAKTFCNDFHVVYCRDINVSAVQHLQRMYDCIIHFGDLASNDSKDVFLLGMRTFLKPNGACIYIHGNRLFLMDCEGRESIIYG